jgi:hypothetical protein
MSKIVDIDKKKKKKPMTAEEAAEWAKRQVFKKRSPEEEPQDLISGKTATDGSFINEDNEDGDK